MPSKTFVLVHGGFIGGWCWNKVTSFLENQGFRVRTPDLPGYGEDSTVPADITLESYTTSLCSAFDEINSKVILVSHSGSGVAVSQTADRMADKIERLVYVSGLLLKNGQTDLQVSAEDRDSMLAQSVNISEDKTYFTLNPDTLKEVLMANCAEADIEYAKARLVPEPVVPALTPMAVDEQRFAFPKVYIECLQDKAITPYLQRKMYQATPCERVLSLDSSHSPFFSVPEKLAAHLLSLVR